MLVCPVAIGGVAMIVVYWSESTNLQVRQNKISLGAVSQDTWFSIDIPSVNCPLTVSASRAALDDDEEVIGVEGGGEFRAYRIKALRDRSRHVVNDMVGGVPISVAYCDITDCVKAYTDPRKGKALLDVAAAGLFNNEMVLNIAGKRFLHKSGLPIEPGKGVSSLPYHTFEPKRMSWKEWVEAHPRSDIYVGAEDVKE